MPERFALRGDFAPLPTSSVERIRATLDPIEPHPRNYPGGDQRFAHLAALGELRRWGPR
ncbi:hypothetical protein [Nocardia sp. NPDC059239]|uniref:hypothetical protein n=1 Tax=Nocardia sp. NPDC059239 TaxID=3346785 RepID=UPI0036C9DC6A